MVANNLSAGPVLAGEYEPSDEGDDTVERVESESTVAYPGEPDVAGRDVGQIEEVFEPEPARVRDDGSCTCKASGFSHRCKAAGNQWVHPDKESE